jgi:adenylate cyclase
MANILVVDDEAHNLNALCRELRERSPHWNVFAASGPTAATRIIKDSELDVVITDLVMVNEQSGIEVLSYAKAKDPLIMVILITAFERRLDRYRAFELGAFDCIQKNMPGVVAVDEIFVKTQAALRFRKLALQQLESQRRIDFLRRYFDPGVFEVLAKEPELLDVRSDILTICFWDIRGFSKLCEILKAHPPLIAGFLREYFEIASKIIFEHHGVLDKFMGDGVMGLFGALAHEADRESENAIHAIDAAIQLEHVFGNVLRKWSEKWTLANPQTIDIGLACGIHTGEVLIGNVGTEFRDQYTALGPNVNFARRIEAHAGKNEILISASTEIRVRHRFSLDDGDIMNNVKNIPGEFRLFRVMHD